MSERSSGLTVSLCIAIAQFWPNWLLIGSVPAVFFVGQSLADYALAPFFVGRRVNLSPVWICLHYSHSAICSASLGC